MSNNNGNCCSSDYKSLTGLGTNTFRVLLPQVFLWHFSIIKRILFLLLLLIINDYANNNHIRKYAKIQQNSFDILMKVNFHANPYLKIIIYLILINKKARPKMKILLY